MSRELPDLEFEEQHFLTVAEVAALLRVSRMTVYRLVHAGELPAIRFGRSFRVPEDAVRKAIKPALGGSESDGTFFIR